MQGFDRLTMKQSGALALVVVASRLLGLMGRDLYREALASPPEGLTRESRIGIGAIVAAQLSGRAPEIAARNLSSILAITDEELTWQALGLVEAPEQSAVEARALVVGALVQFAAGALAEFGAALGLLVEGLSNE